ncbi:MULTISPECIES: hypothetical protein [Thermus]|uniref:Glycosyltransferase RgtA/B/C/D-like domain-containing protein n=1 Tax=Thermus thermophilus TaxID=274 RepID=A0A7R7YHL5_THETH|nr:MULTISPECIES: hypothetical protein [Thermus]QZY59235.1 hypothetical protein K7H19_03835 [Thermus thermophilus]BCP65844.1 hypothetical protein TthHB5018_07780 [Thermus thermophilus]BDE45103.1 hypothetical protein TthHB8_07460 [Thermus thermophilus]
MASASRKRPSLSLPLEPLLGLLLALPVGVAALALVQEGYLSHANAAYLGKVYTALDRGKLETLGFSYPPLPLLLLLPWPSPWAPAVLGALALGLGFGLLLTEARRRSEPLLLVLFAGFLLSPAPFYLVAEDLAQTLGLVFLWWAWTFYRRWLDEGLSFHLFASGLVLGAAVYTTPIALPLGLFFALGLGLFRRLEPPAWAAASLVLLFPLLSTLFAWGYLSWTFTGETAFLYAALPKETPSLGTVLLASPAYLGMGLLILLRPRASFLLYPVPLLLFLALPPLGFGYTLPLAVGLLFLFALGGLPRLALGPRIRAVGLGLALLQAALGWALLPSPEPPPDALERAIGQALAQAPPRSILADDRESYRLLAWAGTARPFLLPPDAGFTLALSAPSLYVDRVLVCPGAGALYRRYGEDDPPGFREVWRYKGCRLLERRPS